MSMTVRCNQQHTPPINYRLKQNQTSFKGGCRYDIKTLEKAVDKVSIKALEVAKNDEFFPIAGRTDAEIHKEIKTKLKDLCLSLGIKPKTLLKLKASAENVGLILDRDGVLTGIPKALQKKAQDFLKIWDMIGGRKVILTNNPRVVETDMTEKIIKEGYNIMAKDIITCGRVTGKLAFSDLKKAELEPTVRIFGTKGMEDIARREGLKVVSGSEKANAVIMSELPAGEVYTSEMLEEAKNLAQTTPHFYMTNNDKKMPYGDGTVPCVGAHLEEFEQLRKDVDLPFKIGGKPSSSMLDMAMGKFDGLKKFLMVGDNSYIDSRLVGNWKAEHATKDNLLQKITKKFTGEGVKVDSVLVGTGNFRINGENISKLSNIDLADRFIPDFGSMAGVVNHQNKG